MVLALAAICVVADYFLKLASQKPNLLKDINLYIGAAIYALAAVGWAVSFQYLKLSTVGTLYSVSTLMLLAALGYHFGETIGPLELVGILLGISAIVLLYKFA